MVSSWRPQILSRRGHFSVAGSGEKKRERKSPRSRPSNMVSGRPVPQCAIRALPHTCAQEERKLKTIFSHLEAKFTHRDRKKGLGVAQRFLFENKPIVRGAASL